MFLRDISKSQIDLETRKKARNSEESALARQINASYALNVVQITFFFLHKMFNLILKNKDDNRAHIFYAHDFKSKLSTYYIVDKKTCTTQKYILSCWPSTVRRTGFRAMLNYICICFADVPASF